MKITQEATQTTTPQIESRTTTRDEVLAMACKSYRFGETFCADGFPQTLPCWNKCGFENNAVPHCMNENIPKHLITETGSPKHYDRARIAK